MAGTSWPEIEINLQQPLQIETRFTRKEPCGFSSFFIDIIIFSRVFSSFSRFQTPFFSIDFHWFPRDFHGEFRSKSPANPNDPHSAQGLTQSIGRWRWMPPRRTSPSTPGGPTSQARYPNFYPFFFKEPLDFFGVHIQLVAFVFWTCSWDFRTLKHVSSWLD